MKGAVEQLLERLGVMDWDIAASSEEYSYHPGRCAVLTVGGERLGVLGEIHPQVAENYGIGERVYCFSLDIALMYQYAQHEKTYKPLPKFPAVSRDLALICDDEIPVLDLEKAIRRGAGDLLEKIRLFDVYRAPRSKPAKRAWPSASRCVRRTAPSTNRPTV